MQAFLEFMSDPTTAGAGSNNGRASAFGNPDDFTSVYDRNWLAMASVLFSESYHKETDQVYPLSVHDFWSTNCEAPAVERSAVPYTLWRDDKNVYGEVDLFDHEVPVWSYAPLRAFGSLRQLRDRTGGKNFGEDYTSTSDDFGKDQDLRSSNSIQSLYRERMCNPTYKYSINDAIGNPPLGGNNNDGLPIRDASVPGLNHPDMRVPFKMLGASAIRRRKVEGCGLGTAACDPKKAPNYYDSSLWSWAYVTSSQCEWHFKPQPATRPLTFQPCAQRPGRAAGLASAVVPQGVYHGRMLQQRGANV